MGKNMENTKTSLPSFPCCYVLLSCYCSSWEGTKGLPAQQMSQDFGLEPGVATGLSSLGKAEN